MNPAEMKCVLVIDENLPLGLIANTAAVLGVTLGKIVAGITGPDIPDADGTTHLGIVNVPLPILKGNEELLRDLRLRLNGDEFAGLVVVDFTDAAQGIHVYEDYAAKMAGLAGSELRYFGLAICGDKKRVNRLTGSLPLLR